MIKFLFNIFLIFAMNVVLLPLAKADENTDKVVAKMAQGDVKTICEGGYETIVDAATKATIALAQTGTIKGDFLKIGNEAGQQFYEEQCQ
jgi:preprotein translocase subunit YajC